MEMVMVWPWEIVVPQLAQRDGLIEASKQRKYRCLSASSKLPGRIRGSPRGRL